MNKCMYGDGHVDCRLLHRFINGLRATVWSAGAGHPASPLIVFFRTFSISGGFAYMHLTRKTSVREGLRRADDIVMERVGPVTRLALLLHGWGAIHLLRGNRANQPIGGVLYISEVTTGKSHVIHYTWTNIGWSLAKLKTAKNAKFAKTSTLPPHKKVESTDHIFSAIATAANLPISWVAHKGKPQSKNLLNLLHLVILSIFVLVIDDLDELVLWWSQGPHMIHVLKAHAWPRFPSVFDFLLPSVLQIGASAFQPWAFRRYVVPFIHLTAKSQLCIGDLLDPSPPSMQKRQNVSLATVQFHTLIFF